MKCLSMVSVISKSAMTPSLRGRTAMTFPGVRPIMRFASFPTARTRFLLLSNATTEGSWMTTPFPLAKTRTLAVPRSIPRSQVRYGNILDSSPRI